MIEGHGDDLYRYDDMVRINFSSNIYQHADHTALKEHLAAHMDIINNYPEPQPVALERMIAQQLGISPESVMVTNGATEAIYLIARLTRKSASIIPQPTFSEYADACRMNDHIISYENTDDLTELPKDRVYWLCNPSNPTGNVMTKGIIEYIVRRSPRYTFVVDQSYEDYTREQLIVPKEMADAHNLLLLHSIGKKYGVPGLRLGYITSHPNTIHLLKALRQPWPINALTMEAGKWLIANGTPAVTDLDAYLQETERLRTELRHIEGIRVFETKTNFMLCEIEQAKAADLKFYLVHEHGILIRDCNNITGLGPHFFRVATQCPNENDALVSAVRQFVQNHSISERR